ncbi:Transporter [Pseudozyma hubeiensis]|nr:Transporter [Pseudozyma hubeiensis]
MAFNIKMQRLLLIVTLVIAAIVWQTQPAVASPAPMWSSFGKQRNGMQYEKLKQPLLAEEKKKQKEEAKAKAAAEEAEKVSERVAEEAKDSLDRERARVLAMLR